MVNNAITKDKMNIMHLKIDYLDAYIFFSLLINGIKNCLNLK
jgi:hypothetical protein